MRAFCFGTLVGFLVGFGFTRPIETNLRTEPPVPSFVTQRIVRAEVRLDLAGKNVLVVGGTCAFVDEIIARNEIAWTVDLESAEQTTHHDACVSVLAKKRIELCNAPKRFKHLRSFGCAQPIDAVVAFTPLPDHLKSERPQIIVYKFKEHRERDDDWLKSESFACIENHRDTVCASFAV